MCSDNDNITEQVCNELIAWYKFDSLNSLFLDSTKNKYNLINNGAQFDNVNYKTGNGSMRLNMNNDEYFSLNTSINLYKTAITNGITFAFWFKLLNDGGDWWFMNLTSSNGGQVYWYRSHTNIYIYIVHGDNSSAYTILNNVIDNNWHHVVWSISDNGNWTLYKDGVNQNININKQLPNISFSTRTIGLPFNAAKDGYAKGNIDDFRIYNKVLTDSEVIKIYNYVY